MIKEKQLCYNYIMNKYSQNYSEEELEEIEERLLREEEEKRKEGMLVSGKGVFELDRIKKKKVEESRDSL